MCEIVRQRRSASHIMFVISSALLDLIGGPYWLHTGLENRQAQRGLQMGG